ncbi:MAG: RNA methyltransferase [Paludibacter sp.]|nr:RNA methyltransferase [Paludibacter sp.]
MKKLHITEMNRLTPEEFKQKKKTPLVVVLDNVRSMHNVGAIFRTGDAFLIEAVYLCGITCIPPHTEIHKTALGAEDTVDWKYIQDTHQAIEQLKNNNYIVLAIEQAQGSTMLPDIQVDDKKKYAVVLGNEVKGVQQSVVDVCDDCIEIPQLGTKHSLNVSVSGGIIIWEFFKKLTEFK